MCRIRSGETRNLDQYTCSIRKYKGNRETDKRIVQSAEMKGQVVEVTVIVHIKPASEYEACSCKKLHRRQLGRSSGKLCGIVSSIDQFH
jgi:hypothetical protein